MDPAHIFRQGLGTVPPRPAHNYAQYRKWPQARDDFSDGDYGPRVAHTLTACCRCRQRKTRCDPTLPRCIPCERSGSVCEYLDAARGYKINRNYVIKLQDKVMALEAELRQYTDEEGDHPPTSEDLVRPGGMIRLRGDDETPRYLGPTSGIAMTRLIMAEAKRYTDTNKISELIPEVRARSQTRSSYPMMANHPLDDLPKRDVANGLVEIYFRKTQVSRLALHERVFASDLDAVYNGDNDPYKTFLVRMVIAIGLQKLKTQYAGLADGYYMAAMRTIEEVIRPKDLKTLQCLILIVQYAMLTPTRIPMYYVNGLAVRICQQEGLTDEKTIAGFNLDPLTVDMRRRLVWVVAAMEVELSHYMGRPSALATSSEKLNVDFFALVDDGNITLTGIHSGPPSPKKLETIHFYKMAECQVEIRKMLYEQKKSEPRSDCDPWCTFHYHQLRALMYRPSPQLPQPSTGAAHISFNSSAEMITISQKLVEFDSIDITWIFLLALNVALSTLLWATSYPEVRSAHPREEVEGLVNRALECLDRCSERWPNIPSTSQLYTIFSKACLQSYDARPGQEQQPPAFTFASPGGPNEAQQPSPDGYTQTTPTQAVPFPDEIKFMQPFGASSEPLDTFPQFSAFPLPQPAFRSNSIFCSPASSGNSRRFSYFPPDFTHMADAPPAPGDPAYLGQLPDQLPNPLSGPPESMTPPDMVTNSPSTTLSSPGLTVIQSPNLINSPARFAAQKSVSPPQKIMAVPLAQPPYQEPRGFGNAPQIPHSIPQQRPLPPPANTMSEWLSPPPQFVSPYNFVSAGNVFNDAMMNGFNDVPAPPFGFQHITAELGAQGDGLDFFRGRPGSLSHSQQLELMNTLETEGIEKVNAYLNSDTKVDPQWW
ncbi:Positive regulator of purine utilization [Escovopsis weberi]|uniref:Positive regulator of purine utilization n=1 Tax=Escovopsis weberi TaxID=150374 RepID=A0A0M9VRI5_ESCWE|nr:Positive regulator of purine utilization [Escovopsis weberi]